MAPSRKQTANREDELLPKFRESPAYSHKDKQRENLDSVKYSFHLIHYGPKLGKIGRTALRSLPQGQ